MKVIAYLGWYRETPMKVKVTRQNIKQDYGFVPCFECEGTGIWDYYPKDYFQHEGRNPTIEDFQCINCKGTGKVLINC